MGLLEGLWGRRRRWVDRRALARVLVRVGVLWEVSREVVLVAVVEWAAVVRSPGHRSLGGWTVLLARGVMSLLLAVFDRRETGLRVA